MPQCTNCRSIESASNKMDTTGILHAIRSAHPGLTTGGSLAVYAGLQLGNAMRKPWVCTVCGWKF